MSPAIHVLWNPSAGTAASAEPLRAALGRRAGVRVIEPSGEAQMRAAAAELGGRAGDTVVAAGGDGTVNTVVRGLLDAGARARFAVLPLGTGNDLSRTLAMSLEPEEALATILDTPRSVAMDVVRVRVGDVETLSVNMATGGNTARVAHDLDPEIKARWGPLCYLRGALDHLLELETFDTLVRFDGGIPVRLALLNVILGNGRTSAGGLHVTPRADPTDGLIDVALILDGAPLDVLNLTTRFVMGDYLNSELVLFRRARKIEIESTPLMPFTVDGNALEPGPASFEVLPGALEVLVGPGFVAQPDLEAIEG